MEIKLNAGICISMNLDGNKIKCRNLCYKHDFSLGFADSWCVWLAWGSLAGESDHFQGELRSQNCISFDIPAGSCQPRCGQSWTRAGGKLCVFGRCSVIFPLPLPPILVISGCVFSFSSSRMTSGMPNMLHSPAEVFKGSIRIYLAPGMYIAVTALI